MPKRKAGLTVKEVAPLLRCTRHTILGHIATGTLTAVNLAATSGRPRWLILDEDLDAFLARRSTATNLASVAAVTVADAEGWRRWLLARPVAWDADGNTTKTMAEATVSKHVKRAKTMFGNAVKDRLLAENPFANVKTGSEVNRDRDYFITRGTAQTVLKGCHDSTWRLIFAFARFGGLRRCEVLTMTWDDILWDVDRIRVNSPKTGLRFAPLFPELKPFLNEAYEAAPTGTKRCIHRYHRLSNLGTQLNRVIEQAGITPWPKTFQNLRATRRTELQEHYQDHVVNAWLGHSSKTAEKHYLQVTDDHWAGATTSLTGDAIDLSDGESSDPNTMADGDDESRGVTGGVITADHTQSTAVKPLKNPAFLADDSSGIQGLIGLATPQGLEP